MMRFSPVSGTTSATVAMATILRNDSVIRRTLSGGHPSVAEQRLHQLERHAGAAEIFFRIRAIGPIGIEHGQRRRQFGFRQVMIGDDHVDAEFVGARAPLRPRECRCPR